MGERATQDGSSATRVYANGEDRPAPAPRPLVLDPRAVWLVLAIAGGVLLLWALRDLIVPALTATALTFIGAPFVNRLWHRRIPRYVGSLLFLVLIGAILSALALLVMPRLVSQLGDLIGRAPEFLDRLQAFSTSVLGAELGARVDEAIDSAQQALGESAQALATGAARGLASFLSATALVVLVPLLTFFFLAELPSIAHFTYVALPERWRRKSTHYGRLLHGSLAHMLRGQLIVALIMSIIYVVGLSVVGVPLPVAIGVIAGFAYFIPFATTPVCIALSALFVLLEPGGRVLFPIAGAAVVALIVQILESWLLTPRIVGSKAQLSPVVVVIAAILGAELFGVAGVLFSLPLATALGVLLRDRYSYIVEPPPTEEMKRGSTPA